MSHQPPTSILILGSGVFGLSTAHALARRPLYASTRITVLDRSPFPSPDGSSIDSSRIVRADYEDPAYASLAAAAQSHWRRQGEHELGGQGRYTESGLVLVADKGRQGEAYVRGSAANVKRLAGMEGEQAKVQSLEGREAINQVLGTGGGSGDWGYVNWGSGWADAEGAMRWLRTQVERTGRVRFMVAEVESLLRTPDNKKVLGAKLANGGGDIHAELVILATGAWTGKLVDLRGRAQATGQVLAYLTLTEEEQEGLGSMPVLLNMSTGLFIIPPRKRVLKVARHAYGYANPVLIPHPDRPESGEMVSVSLPFTSWDDKHSDTISNPNPNSNADPNPNTIMNTNTHHIPPEGEAALRTALQTMIPGLSDRPFSHTRLCWYTDTPSGDFIIDYHPEQEGLFIATGGSGHGFKFLPVIGERVVDCVAGSGGLEGKWKWRGVGKGDVVVTEDGSRGGRRGMVLREEFEKGGDSRC